MFAFPMEVVIGRETSRIADGSDAPASGTRRAGRRSAPQRAYGGAMRRKSLFSRFASKGAAFMGRPVVFGLACTSVVVWVISGPFLGFSELWQLTINTGTTIVTFLMVFLIQNSQNRDAETVQIKLDELLRAVEQADNRLLDLEEMSDHDLASLREEYEKMAALAREEQGQREEERR
jgi:low affinity Fe/Cu permease